MFDTLTRIEAADLAAEFDRQDVVIEQLMAGYKARPPEVHPPVLPHDVDVWPADHVLAILLSSVDPAELCAPDRVRYLQAQERLNAAGSAATMQALYSVADAYDQLPEDLEDPNAGASMETRAALGWTPQAADTTLNLAHDLVERLPAVLGLLKVGSIDLERAKVIVRSTAHLSVAHARAVVTALPDEAFRMTTGQLRARVRRACLDVDPDSSRQEEKQAIVDRRFVSWTEPDGTLSLLLSGIDPLRGQEIIDRIRRIARHHNTGNESRTMDQLRADVACDLLSGTTDATVGRVHLTVDLASLFDPDVTKAAELAGYGPVLTDIADQSRRQFEDAGWDWTVHLPESWAPVADGHTRRRPTSSQQRRVRAKFRTCIAPGCRKPTISCDIDHTRTWSETGVTDSENLGPLCRPDHCTRHQSGWTYSILPDGDILWSSPIGTTYTVHGADPP